MLVFLVHVRVCYQLYGLFAEFDCFADLPIFRRGGRGCVAEMCGVLLAHVLGGLSPSPRGAQLISRRGSETIPNYMYICVYVDTSHVCSCYWRMYVDCKSLPRGRVKRCTPRDMTHKVFLLHIRKYKYLVHNIKKKSTTKKKKNTHHYI
jgi:hypothetical protein